MPHEGFSEEIPSPAKSGPRHAAHRRSLLKRLHMPFGKAVALAAMPSAALLGMGFSSPLAKAEQQSESRYRAGSCVEMRDPAEPEGEAQPDQQERRQEPEPEQPNEVLDEARRRSQAVSAEPDPAEEEQRPAPVLSVEGRVTEAERTEGEPVEGEPVEGERTEGEPVEGEPDETDKGELGENQLTQEQQPEEPLSGRRDGVDDAESDAQADSASPTLLEAPEDTGALAELEELEELGRDVADAVASATGAVEPEQQPREERPEADEKPAPDTTSCTTDGRVAGRDEQTAFTLPNNPWYLEASSLTLRGLRYHGVVNVTTADGRTKQVLKFTADEADVGDLHQIFDGPDGVRHHLAAAPGSVSTFRNGTVTMYTERLQGKLFGLAPIVFDPEHEPLLDLRTVSFTEVYLTQAGQFGGELTMPGMASSIEPG